MTHETLIVVFGWMTVLNVALFTFSSVAMLIMRDFAANLHARLFDIDANDVNRTFYGWLGLYKIMIIMFNLMPWVALKLAA